MHHVVRQHGDLVARHIDGGQSVASDLVDRAARQDRQAGGGNVNAQSYAAAAQALDRERVVNLGGGRVVNRKSAGRRQRQLIPDGGRFEPGKAGALGEILQQKTAPVKLVGRIDGAGLDQQFKWPPMRGARGLDHRLVLCRILVGLEQNLVQLLADRRRARPLAQLPDPLLDLQRDLLLLLDRRQGLGDDLGWRPAKASLAGAAKIMRCFKQAHQRAGLLLQRRFVTEIFARQVGKAEFFLGRKLPGQFQFDALADGLCSRQQLRRRWFLEPEQDVGGLDLDPLAAVELHLRRGLRL